MPARFQFVVLSLLVAGTAIGQSPDSGVASLAGDRSAPNKSWPSSPTEHLPETSSPRTLSRRRREARRRDVPPAHRPGGLSEKFAEDLRRPEAQLRAASQTAQLSSFHDVLGLHRRGISRHLDHHPGANRGPTATTAASPYASYEAYNLHTTSRSDHCFLARKFSGKAVRLVAAVAPVGSTVRDPLRAVAEQQKEGNASRQRAKKMNLLLAYIGGKLGDEKGSQRPHSAVGSEAAEVLSSGRSSFRPDFDGFSAVFSPSVRSPQAFTLLKGEFAPPLVLALRGQRRQNCSVLLDSGYLPTGAETFSVLGRWGVLLCSMETGMVLCTLAIFSRECLYLFQHWPPKTATLSCAALSVFPFTSVCALTAVIFPHMYDVASALVMLYLPFSLVMYYELVAAYTGGCHVLWELLADQRMPLKGPPLCCVLPPCCGQGPILTRKRQQLIRAFIYQLLVVPAVLIGVIFVCTLLGIHPGDRLEATNASPYLMLIQALSFVLGTYALVICVKLAANQLPHHGLRRKFTVFHLHYTVTRLQVTFFKLTGLTSNLPCIPPLSSMASGIYMSCAMLIGQCLLMSTVSQYFFLHPLPQSLTGGNVFGSAKDAHSERPCPNCEQSALASRSAEYAEETFSSEDPARTSRGLVASRCHTQVGRAYSHPVTRPTGAGVVAHAALQSLSIGNATEDARIPLSTNRYPASRAKLSLDLKNTHTMTLERQRRQRVQCSGSLEGLDLERSYIPRQQPPQQQLQRYFGTEVTPRQLQGRRELLEHRKRLERHDCREQHECLEYLRHEFEQQRRGHALFNPMMTRSLDEALRLQEIRERQTRPWRVSLSGGEPCLNGGRGVAAGGWPVSSLEEVTPLTPADELDSDPWINGSRWLR